MNSPPDPTPPGKPARTVAPAPLTAPPLPQPAPPLAAGSATPAPFPPLPPAQPKRRTYASAPAGDDSPAGESSPTLPMAGRLAAETIDLFPDPLVQGSVPNLNLAHGSTLAKVQAISDPDQMTPAPLYAPPAATPAPAAVYSPPPFDPAPFAQEADEAPVALSAPSRRPRRLRRLAVASLLVGAGGVAAAAVALPGLRTTLLSPFTAPANRPDLILHKVSREYLQVTVVERGTLESSENREVVCKLKAGSKGTYASTIRWVIDDGSIVTKNQLLMELDDSALQDQFRAQSIVVEKAKAEWINAEEEVVITNKTSQAETATAVAALKLADLDLDKYLGLRADPALTALGAVGGPLGMLVERGEFRQKFDDVSGRLKLAESDLEAYKDRSAWAERAVRLKYITPSQAKVEQSKLAGAQDGLAKLVMEKNILENFLRQRESTDLLSKLEVAKIGLDKAQRQAHAKEVQAEASRKTKYSVYNQELEKLHDIEEQIRETKIVSPQDGMAVYYKEASRFGSGTDGIIQQGAQVKEGQKLLRIPDLRKMQVNTRVHEAMISRIRGDDRQSTGYLDTLRVALLVSPNAMNRLVMNSELVQTVLRDQNRAKEYVLASQGQKARVRIDAFPDRTLDAHVRTVAAVASQNDWMSADVKVYQTLVTVDESIEGLKPDMSAEVTIQVDPPQEPVLCVPIQSIVGGAEAGPKRRVYVMTPAGPVERVVELGLFNDKMVEVRAGILEDDQVILNPKVFLGEKAKTRDEVEAPKTQRPNGNGKNGQGKKKG